MKMFATVTFAAVLSSVPAFALQQQPGQTSPSQNEQDVPHQQPGTSNPDMNKQRHPTPATPRSDAHNADVPRQKPGTNNPDVASQRHAAPKKSKRTKSTANSSTQP